MQATAYLVVNRYILNMATAVQQAGEPGLPQMERKNNGFRQIQDLSMRTSCAMPRTCFIHISIWSIQLGVKIPWRILRQLINLLRLKMSKLSRLFRYVVKFMSSMLLLLPTFVQFCFQSENITENVNAYYIVCCTQFTNPNK